MKALRQLFWGYYKRYALITYPNRGELMVSDNKPSFRPVYSANYDCMRFFEIGSNPHLKLVPLDSLKQKWLYKQYAKLKKP